MMDKGHKQVPGVIRFLRLLRWGAIGLIALWASVVAFDAVTGARIGGPAVRAFVDHVADQTQPNADLAAEQARTIRFNASPRALPSFQFTTPADRCLTIEDFGGRVVLLNFWATWCAPCRKEMPTLDRLEAQLASRAFVVVPISIDHGDAATVGNLVKQFYAAIGVTHLGIYLEPNDNVMRQLGLDGIPTTLLIDKNGESIGRTVGAAVWDSPRMISLLRGVIAGTKQAHQEK